MNKNFYTIFKTFFKVGTMLLGGGYVILPLLTSELVEKKKWITSDELCEYYALSTALPGIIAANTAIFTGRKLLGTKGAIAAVTGMVLPAFVSIILLAYLFSALVSIPTVQNIFWGVGIGVIVLLFLAVKEMWTKSVTDKFTLAIYLVCLIAALCGKIPLPLIIIASIVVGIFWQKYEDNKKIKEDCE